jgi:hypothetical protein
MKIIRIENRGGVYVLFLIVDGAIKSEHSFDVVSEAFRYAQSWIAL